MSALSSVLLLQLLLTFVWLTMSEILVPKAVVPC